MERNGDEKTEKEGGSTSTRNLIMHGRAAGAKERKRDGWRGPTYAEGWGAGGEEEGE